uniref:Uncharacterized protein n=1 Tax=Ananas comosus var. bracteatus TaxID=296719 RepID=A0A6V7PI67_ANACO|nr:unnamed protein product [Ananas comosus var. bracteatus]
MRIGHSALRCRQSQATSRWPGHRSVTSTQPQAAKATRALLGQPTPAPVTSQLDMHHHSRHALASASRGPLSEEGPSSNRPSSVEVFLPPSVPAAGQPDLVGCVARVEVPDPHPSNIDEILARGLAARFGGSSTAFRVASFLPRTRAVFFPNWVARESAIGRSPIRIDNFSFHFSRWVEVGERARGYLRCKAWIRLRDWPILCWNREDVKAAVSGFGELWEVDAASDSGADVSYYRLNIRCRSVDSIPEVLDLMVEDRRFVVPIEIESSEAANPILLGEGLDERLGLTSLDEQERFIRQTGFKLFLLSGTASTAMPPNIDTLRAGGELTRTRPGPVREEERVSGKDIPREPPSILPLGLGPLVSPCGGLDSHFAAKHGGPPQLSPTELPDPVDVPTGLSSTELLGPVDVAHSGPPGVCAPSLQLIPGLSAEHGGPPQPARPQLSSTELPDLPLPARPQLLSTELPGPVDVSARLGAHCGPPGVCSPSHEHLPGLSAHLAGPSRPAASGRPNFILLSSGPHPSNSLSLGHELSGRSDKGCDHLLHPDLPQVAEKSLADREPTSSSIPRPLGPQRSGKVCSYRRSQRLADKNIGNGKTSLQRAQAILCKKVKVANLLSKTTRAPCDASSAPSTSAGQPSLQYAKDRQLACSSGSKVPTDQDTILAHGGPAGVCAPRASAPSLPSKIARASCDATSAPSTSASQPSTPAPPLPRYLPPRLLPPPLPPLLPPRRVNLPPPLPPIPRRVELLCN